VTSDQSHKEKILITGGSGLVGMHLTSGLLAGGYNVAHLSRKHDQFGKVRVFRWAPEKGILDPVILEGVDHIIHLAGAGIGEGRWSKKRRREITESRTMTTRLLHSAVMENNFPLKSFISASGVGYYGMLTSASVFSEEDNPAVDFLASVCQQWEDAASLFEASGIRTVKVRTAMVLAEDSLALKRLLMPLKTGLVLKMGSGKQYLPWIHISDLCRIYIKAVEDSSMRGAFNASAPEHTTHNSFMELVSELTGKPLFPVNIPSFVLHAALGEMAGVVTKGSRISSSAITGTGFSFSYPTLREALSGIIHKD
jgi:uncharacterized protein (TIGR01777 family)